MIKARNITFFYERSMCQSDCRTDGRTDRRTDEQEDNDVNYAPGQEYRFQSSRRVSQS